MADTQRSGILRKMMERWEEIDGFDDYLVSDLGYVMNIRTDREKKPTINKQGVCYVNLSQDNQQAVRSVAVLVATAFVDNPYGPGFDTVIHKDGDRENCAASNLLWRPRWHAIRYHQEINNAERRRHLEKQFVLRGGEESDEIFTSPWVAASTYGIWVSAVRNSLGGDVPTFPDSLVFEYV